MKDRNNFYVTTPIYYVTAKPHLGSLYSTLLADTIARWNTIKGKSVFFLTGTDEHGQKIAQTAAAAGKEPKNFVDEFIPEYKKTWDLYDIQYSQFMRTTELYHVHGAQHLVMQLMNNGYIYKSEYKGWYCTPCETFVAEIEAKDVLCSSCGRTTHVVSEETYFFKLSAFQQRLLDFYTMHPDFITPKERFNEVISFVESGLKDLSISRTTVSWGVPFPGDPKHTIYVWVEALSNYITGVGYGQLHKEHDFAAWWPADVHVLGKDIVRFHAVYWPAMLMAAELPLPKKLLVHGWIKVDKQKMSKSLGNVVDPVVLQEKYGAEQIRYYLLRQIPVNQDGDFSIADVETRIESDLANDLGNLLNRMVLLAHKYDVLDVPSFDCWSDAALELRDESINVIEDYSIYMDEQMFHHALARLWKFIHAVNTYFHAQEPWKVIKNDDRTKFLEIISVTCHSLRTIAYLLWPVIPQKMEQLLMSLGVPYKHNEHTFEHLELSVWNEKFLLHKIAPLFEKPIKEEVKEQSMHTESTAEIKQENYITIDDVIKVELIVGTISACQAVEDSDKLLQMTVDMGDKGTRTVLAGIRKWYQPDELVGKRGLYIANLKPRKMAGIESQGMMLVAEDKDGKLQLMSAPESVVNGTRLR